MTPFGTPENRHKSSIFDKVVGIMACFFVPKSDFHVSTLQQNENFRQKLLQTVQTDFLKKSMTTFPKKWSLETSNFYEVSKSTKKKSYFAK